MPCCGNTDKKPSESVAASTVATPPEQVKTAESGISTAVHAEENERAKKRDCGCQC